MINLTSHFDEIRRGWARGAAERRIESLRSISPAAKRFFVSAAGDREQQRIDTERVLAKPQLIETAVAKKLRWWDWGARS